MLVSKRKIRILAFDIESRPLSFWYEGKPSAEITAIASCWFDDINSMQDKVLGQDDSISMLQSFVDRYNEADMVSGHYVRAFDLPMINGALMEFGLPKLSPKLVCDTRLDMSKKGDIPASQEYLGDLLGISITKVHMGQHAWRTANRLTPEGLEATRKRVTTDVYQHMLIRGKMLELNLLKSPRMWYP
jgi:hypothetical protein